MSGPIGSTSSSDTVCSRATSAAHGRQPTALVTVEVDGNDVDLGTDDPAVERESGLVLEHLAERRELLVLPVRVDDDLPDPLVDHIAHVETIRGTTTTGALSCGSGDRRSSRRVPIRA